MKLQILATLVAEKNNGSNDSHIQMFVKGLTPLELSSRLYIVKIIKLLFLVLKIIISLNSRSTFGIMLLSVNKNAKE